MPVSYEILEHADVTIVSYSGTVTYDCIRQSFDSYINDPRYEPGRRELADMSGVTGVDMEFEHVNGLLARVTKFYSQQPRITLISIFAPDDLAFGMSRMFQTLSDNDRGIRVSVESEEAAALAWLELEFSSISELREGEAASRPSDPDPVPH